MIDSESARILLAKPERIATFEPRFIERLSTAIGDRKSALVEIAGRDSIAAGIVAGRSGDYDALVPAIVYTGTLHGNWELALGNARALAAGLTDHGDVKVLEPVVLGSPRWWHASAGRYSGELARIFGFSATCVACHMYFHAAKVPLAHALGTGGIIAGERLSHDGRLKLNQLEPSLAAYSSVLESRGVELVMPLRDVSEGKHIEEIVGPWSESAHQLMCVMEGNYRDAGDEMAFDAGALDDYLERYLVPFTRLVLDSFDEDETEPDYLSIATEVTSRLQAGA